MEGLQHLHPVGRRRAQPGQLRLRPRPVRPRSRRLADPGLARHRCAGAVRAAHRRRVHGLPDRPAVPGHEPDLLRRPWRAAPGPGPGCGRDRVVRHPDLPGHPGARRDGPGRGAVGRWAGAGVLPRSVGAGLDLLPRAVGRAGGDPAAWHGRHPPLRGGRRADRAGDPRRALRMGAVADRRGDRLVGARPADRRRDVGADPGRCVAVDGDLRHLRPQLLRLHPRRGVHRRGPARQLLGDPAEHAVLRRRRRGAGGRAAADRRAGDLQPGRRRQHHPQHAAAAARLGGAADPHDRGQPDGELRGPLLRPVQPVPEGPRLPPGRGGQRADRARHPALEPLRLPARDHLLPGCARRAARAAVRDRDGRLLAGAARPDRRPRAVLRGERGRLPLPGRGQPARGRGVRAVRAGRRRRRVRARAGAGRPVQLVPRRRARRAADRARRPARTDLPRGVRGAPGRRTHRGH